MYSQLPKEIDQSKHIKKTPNLHFLDGLGPGNLVRADDTGKLGRNTKNLGEAAHLESLFKR